MNEFKCIICSKLLTDEEIASYNPVEIYHTCFEHRRYARFLNFHKVRIDLGIETKPEIVHCAICNKILTDEEFNNSSLKHFNYVCKEHYEYGGNLNAKLVREKLGIQPLSI